MDTDSTSPLPLPTTLSVKWFSAAACAAGTKKKAAAVARMIARRNRDPLPDGIALRLTLLSPLFKVPAHRISAHPWRRRVCALRRPRSVLVALLREPPCVRASLDPALARRAPCFEERARVVTPAGNNRPGLIEWSMGPAGARLPAGAAVKSLVLEAVAAVAAGGVGCAGRLLPLLVGRQGGLRRGRWRGRWARGERAALPTY